MAERIDPFKQALIEAMSRYGRSFTQPQLEKLCIHYQAVIEINPKMNLTRITDPVEAAVKHYADSLSLLRWVEQNKIAVDTVLDVGTGAGFPAYPLAVMKPEWDITAIDGTAKKINFLQRVIDTVSMTNLHVEHGHTDHWLSRRTYSIVLAKAVTPLAKCLPFAAKLTTKGGYFVAYKTASLDPREQADAEDVLNTLPLQSIGTFDYDLHYADEMLCRRLTLYRRRSV